MRSPISVRRPRVSDAGTRAVERRTPPSFPTGFGAIDGGVDLMIIGNEGRYTFLPEVLAALALLGIAVGGHRSERWVARALVAWLLMVGFVDLGDASQVIKHGPVWLDEVGAWRQDESHPIAIWPGGWIIKLGDH